MEHTGTESHPASLAEMFQRHPDFIRQWHVFHYRPADTLHPSWRRHFAANLHADVWSQVRARAPLSRHILDTLDLQQRLCQDWDRPEWPTALLDPERLLRLARHIGAVLLAPRIRNSMARQQVLDWKEKLSPEAYRFALTSASLLRPLSPLPEPDERRLPHELGYDWIHGSLADTPEALRLRACLKLPIDCRAPELAPAALKHMVTLIHSALEPAWFSLFAAQRP